MSNKTNTTNSIKSLKNKGFLPKNDSIYLCFNLSIPTFFCVRFDSLEAANKFLAGPTKKDYSEPIKFTKDF